MFSSVRRESVVRFGLFVIAVATLAAAALVAVALQAGRVSAAGSAQVSSPGRLARSAVITDVVITPGFTFEPAVITVTMGSSVRWTNTAAFNHTVTGDDGGLMAWGSPVLATNDMFTQTFAAPGVYPYHCAIHISMHGTVVVLAPVQAFLPILFR